MFSQGSVWDPKNEGVFGSTQTSIQSLQYSQKYAVVPYQQLIKDNLKCTGAAYCSSPALSRGYYQWKPCSFTLLAKCHGFSLAGDRCTETFSTTLAELSLFSCKTFQVWISWRNIMLTALIMQLVDLPIYPLLRARSHGRPGKILFLSPHLR